MYYLSVVCQMMLYHLCNAVELHAYGGGIKILVHKNELKMTIVCFEKYVFTVKIKGVWASFYDSLVVQFDIKCM